MWRGVFAVSNKGAGGASVGRGTSPHPGWVCARSPNVLALVVIVLLLVFVIILWWVQPVLQLVQLGSEPCAADRRFVLGQWVYWRLPPGALLALLPCQPHRAHHRPAAAQLERLGRRQRVQLLVGRLVLLVVCLVVLHLRRGRVGGLRGWQRAPLPRLGHVLLAQPEAQRLVPGPAHIPAELLQAADAAHGVRVALELEDGVAVLQVVHADGAVHAREQHALLRVVNVHPQAGVPDVVKHVELHAVLVPQADGVVVAACHPAPFKGRPAHLSCLVLVALQHHRQRQLIRVPDLDGRLAAGGGQQVVLRAVVHAGEAVVVRIGHRLHRRHVLQVPLPDALVVADAHQYIIREQHEAGDLLVMAGHDGGDGRPVAECALASVQVPDADCGVLPAAHHRLEIRHPAEAHRAALVPDKLLVVNVGVGVLLLVEAPVGDLPVIGGREDVLAARAGAERDHDEVLDPAGGGVKHALAHDGAVRRHEVVAPHHDLVEPCQPHDHV
mmetsp:Transcript_9077/g.23384  ORF Transcript_9077/g.23384 Transcript_9077/m.23384 type:complete len:498 (-) Transcript_9077:68-1561(-)